VTAKGATDDSALARKAVVEGRRWWCMWDYLLKPVGRSLEDTPELIYQMEDPAVKGAIDSQLMHDCADDPARGGARSPTTRFDL